MKKPFLVCGAVLTGLVATESVSGAMIEHFDSYTTQAEFQSVWRPWSADGSSMQLSTTSHSGSVGVSGVAAANYQTRNARDLDSYTNYLGTDASPVTFEFWVYDTNPNLPTSPAGARNYNELRAYTGDGIPAYGTGSCQAIIAMGLYNTPVSDDNYHARVYYGGVSAWYSLNTHRQVGWHKLTAQIGQSWVKFLVDDNLDTTVNLTPGTDRLFAFDGVVLGSGLTSGGYDVNFDDLMVSKAPEPAALLFLGIGAVFFLRKPRNAR